MCKARKFGKKKFWWKKLWKKLMELVWTYMKKLVFSFFASFLLYFWCLGNRSNCFFHNMWRNDNLISYTIKYSRLCSTFSKAMNKITSTRKLFFSLVGPCGLGKSHFFGLVKEWYFSTSVRQFFSSTLSISL